MIDKICFIILIGFLLSCQPSHDMQDKSSTFENFTPQQIVMKYYELATNVEWSYFITFYPHEQLIAEFNSLFIKNFSPFEAGQTMYVFFDVSVKPCIIQKDIAICSVMVKILGSIDGDHIYSTNSSVTQESYKLIKTHQGWKIQRALDWSKEKGWVEYKWGIPSSVTIIDAEKLIKSAIEYCKRQSLDKKKCEKETRNGLRLLEIDSHKAKNPKYWGSMPVKGKDWESGAKVYENTNLLP